MPVEPLLQMPLRLRRDHVGQVGHRIVGGAPAIQRGRRGRCRLRRRSPRCSRSSSQSGTSHRTGTGTAPSFHVASTANTNSGELRMPSATRSPRPTPRSASAAGELARAPVELAEGQRHLAAVHREVHVGDLLATRRPRARGSAGRCSSLRRSLVLLHHGKPGGRRSAQGIAVSSWVASRKSVASSKGRPAHCTPMGSPLALQATGRLSAG